ncbi:MAG: AI-2E family transporter [Treponema sp.]|jgi:predicted PurR-regulated permease PerM|nr:AI-2E family transporter [Treponema sp.]
MSDFSKEQQEQQEQHGQPVRDADSAAPADGEYQEAGAPGKNGKFSLPPVQTLVFAAILVVFFLLVCRLFAPFFTVLLWSVLLYVLVSPLHHRLIRKLDFSKASGRFLKNLWAVLFALGTLILILIPITFVTSVFSRQIMDLTRFLREIFDERPGAMREFFDKISALLFDLSQEQVRITGADIEKWLMELVNSSLQQLFVISSRLARNLGSFFVGLVMLVFTLFFLYTDSPYLSRLVLHSIPIRREYLGTITRKFMDITRSLFFGYIMVALIQALMAYIIFTIFGIKGALILAMITFIAVFIPMIGGGLVWLPLGLIRIASGDVLGGVLFLLVCGFFISLLDNVLRPMFLKDRIQLHPLIIFFAILGGVSAYGFNGLILGPMVVIMFLTVLDLFLNEHKIEEEPGDG